MTKIWNLIGIIVNIYYNFCSPPLLAQHWSSVRPIPFQIRLRRYFDCRTTCRGQPLHVTLAILNRDVIKSMTSSSRHFKLLHSLRLLSHRYSFFYLFLNQFEEDGHLVQFASFTGPSVCCDKSECMLRQMVTQLIFSSIWYWNISSLNHIIWHSF